MKTKFGLIAGALFLLQAVTGWAQTTTFTVSATVPKATGVTLAVSSVNATTNQFTALPAGTTALSFDPLTFNTINGIYLPNHYFAIDAGVTGGAGTPDLTLTYNEGTNPNGVSTKGLGFHGTVTFAKEVLNSNGSTTETLLTAHGPKKVMSGLNEHVTAAEVTPGWPREYIGLCTGSTTAPADPSNCTPFSNGDKAGTYTGSLVVTATVG